MKAFAPLELSQVIHWYFNGEKAEMMAILAGSLVMVLFATFAEFERELISEGTKAGLASARFLRWAPCPPAES